MGNREKAHESWESSLRSSVCHWNCGVARQAEYRHDVVASVQVNVSVSAIGPRRIVVSDMSRQVNQTEKVKETVAAFCVVEALNFQY